MAEVEIRKVYKRYDKVEVIHGIDLEIADGEFVVLVGPSGCGKSTTLRMIAGLEDISDGEIRIGGRVVNNVEPKNRDIAMVFQNYAIYPHMSVYKNIAFGLRTSKMAGPDKDRRVRETAEILGLTELLERRPAQLSGGQRQRVAMGRAMGARSGGLPVRRTAVEPGCPAARPDAPGDQEAAPGGRHHDRLRDPRPDRGDDPRRPDRHHARRPHPADRHADRGSIRESGDPVRRPVHRQPGDEHAARQDRQPGPTVRRSSWTAPAMSPRRRAPMGRWSPAVPSCSASGRTT